MTESPEFVVLVYTLFFREYPHLLFFEIKQYFLIVYTEQYIFLLSLDKRNMLYAMLRRTVQSILHFLRHSREVQFGKEIVVKKARRFTIDIILLSLKLDKVYSYFWGILKIFHVPP